MDIKLLKKSMTMLPWYIFNGKRTRLNFFSEHLTMSSQNTLQWKHESPTGNYVFKVNSRNTRTRCEIYSKLKIKIPKPCHWCRSGVFIVNFGHISHIVLEFLLLTMTSYMPTGKGLHSESFFIIHVLRTQNF